MTNEIIKESHEFVFSRVSMSAVEQDLFALFLSAIREADWTKYKDSKHLADIPEYTFSSVEMCEWFNCQSKDLYKKLKDASMRLDSRRVGIFNDSTQEFKFNPLFNEVSYRKGKLSISPNHKIVHAYSYMEKGFSLISKKEFLELRRDTSKRVYAMLCRFKSKGVGSLHPFSLHELYGHLGLLKKDGQLEKKAYKSTGAFVNKILKPSIIEIANVEPKIKFFYDETGKNFGFKYYKNGRKIEKIELLFSWSENWTEKIINESLTPFEQACIINKKIIADEDVTITELKLLKSKLADLIMANEQIGEKTLVKIVDID